MRKFSIFNFKLSTQQGFTLIELLVVIGILGILASALVATIDPFEQLKKAQDANLKNTAVEFINANIRYYTTHNNMPWDDNTACSSDAGGRDPSLKNLTAITSGCIGALIADNEIKAGFTSITDTLQKLFLTELDNQMSVCFQPQSKSQRKDANTKYDQKGDPIAGCISTSGQTSTACYWCAK